MTHPSVSTRVVTTDVSYTDCECLPSPHRESRHRCRSLAALGASRCCFVRGGATPEAKLPDETALGFVLFPLLINALDIFVSSLGMLRVTTRAVAADPPGTNPMAPLKRGFAISCVSVALARARRGRRYIYMSRVGGLRPRRRVHSRGGVREESRRPSTETRELEVAVSRRRGREAAAPRGVDRMTQFTEVGGWPFCQSW